MGRVETKPQTTSRGFIAPDRILEATDLTDLDFYPAYQGAVRSKWGLSSSQPRDSTSRIHLA
jgi:hypothetical protein